MTTTRPVAPGDAVQFTRTTNEGIATTRGVLLRVAQSGEAFVELADHTVTTVAVEHLEPATPTRQFTARRNNAPAGQGVAIAVTASGAGITFDIHDADTATGAGRKVTLGFGDAADIHRALGAMLYSDDHSADGTDAGDVVLYAGNRVRIVGQNAAELRDMFGEFGTVVRTVPAKLEHGGIQVRFDDGRVTTLARRNLRRA